METANRMRPFVRVAAAILAGCAGFACAAIGSAGEKVDEKTSVWQLRNVGRDPHAFDTAEEMYKTAATKEYDTEAAALIAAVDEAVQGGFKVQHSLTSNAWWVSLARLNPYRKTEEVQLAVARWAKRCARDISREPATGSPMDLRQGNEDYIAAEFGNATKKYVKMLQRFPRHLDARNNLALAQLHNRWDLIAQLQLEILRELDDEYVPGLINLTVVYERLGRTEDAEKLAHRIVRIRHDVAPALFNSAWYFNREGQYVPADPTLKRLSDANLSPKYIKFYELNQRQIEDTLSAATRSESDSAASAAEETGFWRNGLAGIWGGKSTWWTWIVSIAVFLAATVIVMAVAAAIGNGADEEALVAFGIFLIGGGFLYLLSWGIPTGGWWVLAILYVLMFGGMTAAAAEDM